tara:strand:+ start:637 stop:3870 length:3234 start_codon:yes stop_codon:yes gene_type:complete
MANSFKEVEDGAEKLIQNIKSEVTSLNSEISKLNKNVFALLNSNGASESKLNSTIKSLKTEIDKLNESIKKQSSAETELVRVKTSLNKKTSEEVINQRALAKASDLEAKSQSKIVGAYQRLNAQRNISKKRLQDLIVAQGRNDSATRKAQKEYDKLTVKVNQANKATSNLSKKGLLGITRGFGNLLGAFGVAGATVMFAQFAQSGFKLAKRLDSLNFAMRTIITDSQELADTQFFLADITERYGAEVVTTTERYIKFLTAAKQSNVELKDTEQIFRSVTKAAGVLGLSTEELNGTYLALEQMLSKGKVTTEELRRQLGERLPGAFGIMADAIGVNTAELDKMLRAGEILSADALPKFAKALEKAYGIENITNVKTLQAETSRLSNAWTNFVKNVTESDGVISKALMSVLETITSAIKSLQVLNQTQEAFNGTLESGAFDSQGKWYKDLGDSADDYALIAKENAEKRIKSLKGEVSEQEKVLVQFEKYNSFQKLMRPGARNAQKAIDDLNSSISTQEGVLRAAIAQLEKKNKLEEEPIVTDEDEKLIEKRSNDAYNLSRTLLKIEIERQRDILDNEKASLTERLDANAVYLEKKRELINLESNYETKTPEITSFKIKQIEAEKQDELTRLTKEGGSNRNRIIEDDFKRTIDFYERSKEASDLSIKQDLTNYKNELIRSGESRKDIEEKVVEREKQLRKESLINFIENEIKKVKAKAVTADNRKQIAKELASLEAKLADANMPDAVKINEATSALKDFFQEFQDSFMTDMGFQKLNEFFLTFDEEGKSMFDNLLENADKGFEEFGVYFNAISEVAQEAFNFINQQSQLAFDAEYSRLQQQKEIALQFAGESAEGREEIERQYEEKRKAIARRQAAAQKEQAIFNIGIDTAQAVMSIWANSPDPTGISQGALTAIIGGIGLAKMAIVAATPVPEFFRGTMNAPEGWAMVDEKRPEIHTDRSGNIKSTGESGANMRFLDHGDKIYTSHEEYFNKELGGIMGQNDILPYNQMMSTVSPSISVDSGLKKSDFMRGIKSLKSTIESKEGSVVNIDKNGFSTKITRNGKTRDIQNNILRLKNRVI